MKPDRYEDHELPTSPVIDDRPTTADKSATTPSPRIVPFTEKVTVRQTFGTNRRQVEGGDSLWIEGRRFVFLKFKKTRWMVGQGFKTPVYEVCCKFYAEYLTTRLI